jgi:pentapeptide MXKDX repeat protein
MSSATTTNTTANVATNKPARKPTLPAKLSKLLVSNYSLIQALSAKGLLTDDNVEAAYAEIKLFSSIEEQTEFYNSYLSSSKDVAKVMKKFVTVRNKPPKAPKAPRKPRAKKSDNPDAVKSDAVKSDAVKSDAVKSDAVDKPDAVKPDAVKSDAVKSDAVKSDAVKSDAVKSDAVKSDAVKPAKKPRTKKITTVVDDSQTDVVKELVEAANTPLTKAPRKRKPKKEPEATPSETTPPVKEQEEDIEEINTQEFSVDGKDYLIDGDNNLYSIDTHEQLATFDPLTKKVVPL